MQLIQSPSVMWLRKGEKDTIAAFDTVRDWHRTRFLVDDGDKRHTPPSSQRVKRQKTPLGSTPDRLPGAFALSANLPTPRLFVPATRKIAQSISKPLAARLALD